MVTVGGSPPVERTFPLIDAELAKIAVAGWFVTVANVGVSVVKLREDVAQDVPATFTAFAAKK